MFDTYKFIKRLQSKGFKEAQATSIVEIIAESREHDLANVATKDDLAMLRNELKSEIKESTFAILKWILPLLTSIVLALMANVIALWFKK